MAERAVADRRRTIDLPVDVDPYAVAAAAAMKPGHVVVGRVAPARPAAAVTAAWARSDAPGERTVLTP